MKKLKKIFMVILICLGMAFVAWIGSTLIFEMFLVMIVVLYWIFFESQVGGYIGTAFVIIVTLGSVILMLLDLLLKKKNKKYE